MKWHSRVFSIKCASLFLLVGLCSCTVTNRPTDYLAALEAPPPEEKASLVHQSWEDQVSDYNQQKKMSDQRNKWQKWNEMIERRARSHYSGCDSQKRDEAYRQAVSEISAENPGYWN